jgi:hypothetical protein
MKQATSSAAPPAAAGWITVNLARCSITKGRYRIRHRIGRNDEEETPLRVARYFALILGLKEVLDKPADLRTADRVGSLAEAKVQLRESWRTFLTWGGRSFGVE